jgi:glycogen debranching enzyme
MLRKKFIRDFWLDDEDFLAFALDGRKKCVRCMVSNPGHCLFTGILPQKKALKVAKRLFAKDLYSGWGIRTMGKNEKKYNPMSYHCGSIWPHDNAIIAWGLRKLGQYDKIVSLTNDIFQAATYFPYCQLPELFCGFTRRGLEGPVKYPTACDPQAWSVSSTFMFLQSLLGIYCREGNLYISRPVLPEWLNHVVISNLRVGGGKADIEFTRRSGKTYCSVIERQGKIRIVIEP